MWTATIHSHNYLHTHTYISHKHTLQVEQKATKKPREEAILLRTHLHICSLQQVVQQHLSNPLLCSTVTGSLKDKLQINNSYIQTLSEQKSHKRIIQTFHPLNLHWNEERFSGRELTSITRRRTRASSWNFGKISFLPSHIRQFHTLSWSRYSGYIQCVGYKSGSELLMVERRL